MHRIERAVRYVWGQTWSAPGPSVHGAAQSLTADYSIEYVGEKFAALYGL